MRPIYQFNCIPLRPNRSVSSTPAASLTTASTSPPSPSQFPSAPTTPPPPPPPTPAAPSRCVRPNADSPRPSPDRAKEEQYGQPLQAEFSSSPDSGGGGGSCVTTESDEDASSPSPDVVRRSLAPVPQERAVLLEREHSLPPLQAVDGDDDLDATWNAIM
jgi:hypothetical protein